MEAEYRAKSSACSEILWFRRLLKELGISCKDPTPLFEDNIYAIRIALSTVYHDHTKHIEVHCHFIRDLFRMMLLLFLIFHLICNWQMFL